MRIKPLSEFFDSGEDNNGRREKSTKKTGVKGPWELPVGWKWARLGEIVNRRNETLDPTVNISLPFVGLEHIQPGELRLSSYAEETDVKSQKLIFYPGDILYGKLRPYLDKAVVATIKGMCSTDFLVLTPKKDVIPEYIVFFMHTPHFVRLSTQNMRGTNHPRISWKILQKFLIPIPPIEEQKRIVAMLDEIQKRLEDAKRLAREAKEEAQKLMASALHDVFSKVEEKDWEWRRLKDIADLKAGGTPSRRVREYWENGTIPWVKISDIPDSGVVERTEEKITELGLRNSSAKLLPPGTILFTIFATISKVGILKIPAATNQAIVGIISRVTINKSYLFYSLKYFGQELVYQGRGGVQDNINMRMLSKLKIPLPPLEEQKRIASYFDSLHVHAQKLVKLYEEREKELEKLFPSILDRAFRGKLITFRGRILKY